MQTVIFWSAVLIIAPIVLAVVMMITQFNAASQSAAVRALQGIGYTNIQMVEKQNLFGLGVWQGCEISDDAKFIATATNPAGVATSMYVCVGGERASVHF